MAGISAGQIRAHIKAEIRSSGLLPLVFPQERSFAPVTLQHNDEVFFITLCFNCNPLSSLRNAPSCIRDHSSRLGSLEYVPLRAVWTADSASHKHWFPGPERNKEGIQQVMLKLLQPSATPHVLYVDHTCDFHPDEHFCSGLEATSIQTHLKTHIMQTWPYTSPGHAHESINRKQMV